MINFDNYTNENIIGHNSKWPYIPDQIIEYSNDMHDVYKNIEDYNPGKKRKVLIVFNDMIADMINNNKLNPVVTELLIRGRKLNISIF